ncbi:MAG TPA: DEAD/DEAH box helicase [Candidatus Fournierella merdipullorum]|uniref:ATP-dependent RNA helicase CshA n=1 Tax=Candidatus Allofournierella merdipullorum TaxID=2838595 RepID=A0A9D2J0A4_9FIRM|nr:DEAD/DEAH box helicase [Candidatus Fournierella merdipullorum]
MDFSELQLIRPLLRAVEEAGYTSPSPIQRKAIPPVLAGRDLLGCAQTGTGKTAAFALPILQRLSETPTAEKGVRALILTPTRELALQIDECFAAYGKYLKVSHTVIFGGVGQAPQVAALQKGAQVLTACPGRLNDLIGQGFVDLSKLEVFVLDEADRMLDMGFIHDVKKVIRQLPEKRQNLLFSATMPKEIEQLAAGILQKPVSVKVDPPSSTVDRIDQSLYRVAKADKKRLLAVLLADPAVKNALVFSRTKHGANAIAAFLTKQGIEAAAIHGNKSQSARVAALEGFKSGRLKALVATDIAARGIDISELSHVFQLDLPEVPETYVHRIGRTGRAGAEGTAVAFCSPEEEEYLAAIEKLIRKKIPVRETPALPRPAQQEAARSAPTPAPAPRKEPKAEQPARKREEENMEQNQQEKPTQGLSASAKRRRRRRRAAASAAAAAAQNGQAPQNAQPRSAEGGPKQGAPKQNAAAKQGGPKQNNQSGQGRSERAPARGPKQAAPARPAREPAEHSAPRRSEKPAKAPARTADEDPGLLLISRKPPAQKFASFEEYMKSRGGPGAPIVGDEE